ncbi:MAG: hypothetical protein DWQ37_13120 [Planctomycetota bacterium]|nr:MAG: hypothetical protein DWQ37_13120 [Planctomycetota bacterium]
MIDLALRPARLCALAALVILVASLDARAESKDASSGAKLTGKVVLEGPPPEPRVINMSKDPKCIELHDGKEVLDEAVLIGKDGGVKNAFVYVRRGAPKQDYPMPDEPAVLDQTHCAYRPRVMGMRVGQQLLVKNSDPVTHNVRSFPIFNRPFNYGQPADSEPRDRVFDRAEREIEVQCDIHPWMHAFIFVMDHPFYCVTQEDGTYEIDGLPPGEYTLALWHEKLGKQQQKIVIGEKPAELNFTY